MLLHACPQRSAILKLVNATRVASGCCAQGQCETVYGNFAIAKVGLFDDGKYLGDKYGTLFPKSGIFLILLNHAKLLSITCKNSIC